MGDKLGTVALPGMYQPRITQGVRIAVGEQKQGKNHPDKLDHIRLATWDENVGKKGSYVMDAEAMKLLAEWYGDTYDREYAPTRVPIWLLANPEEVADPVRPGQTRPEIPKSILWTRMARYGGGVAVCSCEKFRLLNEKQAAAQGLDWPIDPNLISSWGGRATLKDFTGPTVTTSRITCYPPSCQYFQQNKCKPQTIFRCVLPFMPRLGAVAEYHTTSWQSTQRLRGSLLLIAAHSGGWLMMLGDPENREQWPFIELVKQERMVSGEGFHAPILHAEYPGTMQRIKAATIETRKMLGSLQQQLAAIEAPEAHLALDSGEDAYAWQHEMSRDTLDDDIAEHGVEAVAQDLAAKAGWSAAKLAACVRKHGDDDAAWDSVLQELQEDLGLPVWHDDEEEAEAGVQGVGYAPEPEAVEEEAEEVADAEFEDAEEEAAPEPEPEVEPEPAQEPPTDDMPPAQEEPPLEAYEADAAAYAEEDPYGDVDTSEAFPEAPENQQRQGSTQRLFGDDAQ